MREIEVKAKLVNAAAVEASLAAMGAKLSAPIKQADRVYLQNGTAFEEITVNTPVLRIRTQTPGKILLTYKHIRGEELDKQEHEVTVDDAAEMDQILRLSGFYQVVAFTKVRRKCEISGYEICLDEVDEVDELGSYIEIEKLIPDGPNGDKEAAGQDVQRELFDFLGKLGISEKDKVLQGYDVLIYNKLHPKL